MDIVYKNKKNITYKMLAIGDIFSYYDNLYMKTQRAISVTDGGFYNAINLKFGGFALFDDNDEIVAEKAQLVVS